MRRPAVPLVVLCGLLPACGGCLFVYSREDTVRLNEPKRAVQFQSETAARLFAAASDQRLRGSHEVRTESLTIPFLASISRNSKLSEASLYNDEVAACDADGDGVITDAEASAYHRAFGPAPEPSPGPDDKVLVQTGSISVDYSTGPYEVFYPQPYATPPELSFEWGHGVDLQTLQQTPQGFRCHLKSADWSGQLRWKARGVTAPPPAAVVLGIPEDHSN
jgi:hypothetical protein